MHNRYHRIYGKLLYLYKQEELNPFQRTLLRRHLRTCSGCRETLAAIATSLDSLQKQIKTAADPHPSAGLHGRIMAAVSGDAETGRTPFYAAGQRRLSLAMAGAVLLITGSFLFQGMSGMLKMQRFEQRLSRPPRPVSSLAVIGSLRKTAASRDLSRVRLSMGGRGSLGEMIHPYLNAPEKTVRTIINNPGSLLPPAILSRITVRLSGSAGRETGL